MEFATHRHLVLAITGASGTHAAKILVEKASWPIDIIVSDWGKRVMQHERVSINFLLKNTFRQFQNDDLFALPSSGSTPTIGMVVLPCSTKTLGEIATGTGNNLTSRAAHCHLKENRTLIICLREAPLTSIDIDNMKRVSNAGGILMPICPPFFMFTKCSPKDVSMDDLLGAFVDRILSLLGQENITTWENIR